MRKAGIAVAAALAWAAPAHAADLATIGCVAQKVDAAVRSQIEADVERNLTESGKRPSYGPGVGAGLKTAAAACAKEHGWTAAAASAAARYTLAKIGMPVAQRVITQRGFDPAALEDQFQALPEETRNRPLTAQESQGLVRDAAIEDVQKTRENAELLSEFFAFVGTIQYAAFEFSAA
ncbi:MAG: hypothetical protein J7500_11370 [Sphingomonas sp.]|uniref:hypothetical protein n=1 Tax=Sphingomonas sp. TaxID=28214 RepID=UPI001B161852|nr:hypothetical protein [Sphingomonas sp.]MBO9623300.1 hypothetical protein [Sphingomonas sp.]